MPLEKWLSEQSLVRKVTGGHEFTIIIANDILFPNFL
jgi:hypothetical protein